MYLYLYKQNNKHTLKNHVKCKIMNFRDLASICHIFTTFNYNPMCLWLAADKLLFKMSNSKAAASFNTYFISDSQLEFKL